MELDNYTKKKVLITAGPTYEPIDPVRFIGNRSSGKMGWSLAIHALSLGMEVVAVVGPNSLKWPDAPNFKYISVESAAEMYAAAIEWKDWYEVGIFSAAVADYTPEKVAENKIKKNEEKFSIVLKKTKDILKSFGEIKKEGQFLVGFALETNNEEENAKNKLTKKNLDMIVLNSLRTSGAGFQHNTNQITIYTQTGNKIEFSLKSKNEVAIDIWNQIFAESSI